MICESVDTTTASNTPLCLAAAIVYARSGCPPSTRMFLCLTRLEPARAGTSATKVLTLPHAEAAVDDQVDAGHIPRSIRREEHERSGQVGGVGHSPHRDSLRVLGNERVVLTSSDAARRQRVHANAVRRP